MKCYKCEKELKKVNTNYIGRLDKKTVIIENTPTYLCENCYEQYYSNDVIANVEKIIEKIEGLPLKLTMIEYSDLL